LLPRLYRGILFGRSSRSPREVSVGRKLPPSNCLHGKQIQLLS
jgi:hypothetical protein